MNKERFEISVNQEDVQNIINCYEKDIEYIKQLEDNWNKLKEWLEEQKDFIKEIPVFTTDISNNHLGMIGAYNNTLEKLQEIEGGMNE